VLSNKQASFARALAPSLIKVRQRFNFFSNEVSATNILLSMSNDRDLLLINQFVTPNTKNRIECHILVEIRGQ
jgi:hypothetical protein